MCRSTLILIVMLSLLAPAASGARKPAAKPKASEAAKAPPTDPNAAPLPPKDARWTLYCQAIHGPDHVDRAKAIKTRLVEASPLKDWYVIHQESESILYYGFYRSINDPKDKRESDRAQRDRKAIVESVQDTQGNAMFAQCFFVEAASPDPAAPPEWDLRNADGYWSVEIGVYKDSPQRKQAAVEAVRAARNEGVPAYYFHGPTASSVCIGNWPRDAVREQEESAAVAADPTQDVLILPQPINIPGNVEIRNTEGQRVKAMAPRIEPVDPSLVATIAKYPSHAVNGEVTVDHVPDPATGKTTPAPKPSLLVRIPKEGPSLLRQNQPPPTLVGPASPSDRPGAGRLRSIGQ